MPLDTSGPAQPRHRRRDQAEARLRAAMLEVSHGRSFQEVTVGEITAAAGLSRSAFYFYYRDKEDLLMQVTADVTEALYEQAESWWDGDGDPQHLVREALTGITELWERNAEILRLVVEVASYDDVLREFWRGLVERLIDVTAIHITDEQAAGHIDAGVDPSRAAETMVWATERVLHVYVATGSRSADEVAASLAPLWVRALYGN